MFWLLLGLAVIFVLLYPLAARVAHYWDIAEKQPLVVDHQQHGERD